MPRYVLSKKLVLLGVAGLGEVNYSLYSVKSNVYFCVKYFEENIFLTYRFASFCFQSFLLKIHVREREMCKH